MSILRAESILLRFGGVTALDNVSMEVNKGEIVGLVGPNGAGKTSLLNVFSGFYRPERGRVFFEGRDITSAKPFQRAKMGIGRTFQKTSEVFKHMTVLDNVMLGAIARIGEGPLDVIKSAVWWGPGVSKEEEVRGIAEEVIEFMELYEYRNRLVGSLPYGLQKKVDIARALAGSPKVLLLDEPMAGLTRDEREDVARYIMEMNRVLGISIVLVEHDLNLVMDLSERVVVLNYGRKIVEGAPETVMRHEEVVAAYMGTALAAER